MFQDDDLNESVLNTLRERGWDADDDLSILTCPHGARIEPDGTCPEGCVSPLVTLGLI